jgi:hypothetical protein
VKEVSKGEIEVSEVNLQQLMMKKNKRLDFGV